MCPDMGQCCYVRLDAIVSARAKSTLDRHAADQPPSPKIEEIAPCQLEHPKSATVRFVSTVRTLAGPRCREQTGVGIKH